jgi:2'-hydroxyisoflavone reductase
MNRRNFLAATAALGLSSQSTWARDAKAKKSLKLLILGGTRFIGLHMAEFALARGHSLTFFNRGRTKTDRLPQVERILGDRNGQIEGLANRSWDAVIDNSGYVPRHVTLTGELLKARANRYLFVSSISAYASLATPNNEQSPVATLSDPATETVDGATYGPLKAACEVAAERSFGAARTIVLRPGLIVGPEDNTDRFTYWPARAARGGDMLAPGSPADPVQLIDARDLAAFAVLTIEQQLAGTFNVVSAPGQFAMGQLIDASIGAASTLVKPSQPAKPIWRSAEFLQQQNVAPWSDMPVWVPPIGDGAGFAASSTDRARRSGLTVRSLEATARDTLAWHLQRPVKEQQALKAGLSPEREATVLAAKT